VAAHGPHSPIPLMQDADCLGFFVPIEAAQGLSADLALANDDIRIPIQKVIQELRAAANAT